MMFLLVIKSSYVGSILWYFSKNNTVTLKQYKNSDLPTPFQNETEIGNKTIFRPHMQNEKKKLIEFQGVPLPK